MDSIFVVCICLSIIFPAGNATYRANEVFALSGCNAELEWTQQETYLDLFAFSLNVFNANGIKIAEKKDMTCKSVIDSSVFCEARNTSGEEWRFFVVLINVTQANSGKYTGQIQTGRNYAANITTELKVIDKPLIKEAQKPILHEPLSIRCNVDGEFEDLIYYWAFNGTDLNYTERIYAESANLTFERLTLADKFSFVSCRVCSSDNCCIESDTYSPDPYSDTRVPSKLGETGGYLRVLHGLGLVIAAIMLLVTGSLLLVTLRRKLATRVSDTHPLHHSFDGHFNTEWSQRITEPNQTVPAEQDNALNCAQIQHYQKANSLQTRKGNTQSACNPVKKGLSVQTVMHLSHTNTMLAGAKDSTNKLFNSDKDHWPCNFECTSDRIGLNESYPVIQQDKNMCDDERTTGATCICLANSGCGRFEPELQESQYTTIDEAALSVYDYAGTNHHGDKIHEDNSNIDVGNFIYDYAALPSP